ncbi:methylated-DNA--[protein]-cysteine S-methyltransferase [Entomobacter blattae]|nr:methylated-DNA--[protein]-cysteine S-methyltransferase [Entomobacter blattae]
MPQLSLHSPIGDLTISEENGSIVSLDWGWGRDQAETPLLLEAQEQLRSYFEGKNPSFSLPLQPWGTDYQKKIWQALTQIPYGETRFYYDIALQAGGSARSVGQANAKNPIPILIPCHRVIGKQGLGGYSGMGDIATKQFLLNLEHL